MKISKQIDRVRTGVVLVVPAIVTLICTLFSLSAVAKEGDTFRPYVSVLMSQDDNLLRYDDKLILPDGVKASDSIVQTLIGIDVDWDISRQNFRLNAEVRDSQYSNNKQLNNQSESFKASWNWSLGSKLNGGVGYSHKTTLASFTDNQTVALSGAKKMTENAFMSGSWLLTPDWRAGVNLSHFETTFDNVASKISNLRGDSVEVSLFHLGVSGNHIGVKLRQNSTEYPNRVFNSSSSIDNQYQLSTALMVFQWQFAGKSTLQFQVGLESLKNKHLDGRNYSDVTVRISYQANLTGKLLLKVSAWREIGPSLIFDATSQKKQVFEVTPVWQLSSKNSLLLQFKLENIVYDDSRNMTDSLQSVSLFWVNKLTSNANITVGYAINQRDSSRLYRDYRSNQFTVQGKLIW